MEDMARKLVICGAVAGLPLLGSSAVHSVPFVLIIWREAPLETEPRVSCGWARLCTVPTLEFLNEIFLFTAAGELALLQLLVIAEGLLFAEGLPQDSAACDWDRCPWAIQVWLHHPWAGGQNTEMM